MAPFLQPLAFIPNLMKIQHMPKCPVMPHTMRVGVRGGKLGVWYFSFEFSKWRCCFLDWFSLKRCEVLAGIHLVTLKKASSILHHSVSVFVEVLFPLWFVNTYAVWSALYVSSQGGGHRSVVMCYGFPRGMDNAASADWVSGSNEKIFYCHCPFSVWNVWLACSSGKNDKIR